MRKIIQISACGHQENRCTQSEHVIYALCDDGTLWMKDNRSIKWEQVDLPPLFN